LLDAPLQLGALSARLVRLWVNPALWARQTDSSYEQFKRLLKTMLFGAPFEMTLVAVIEGYGPIINQFLIGN